ncbi:MAG: hypothetical protein PHH37_01850 [Paludibacter sp.]|nr:hypothetical protein [Paludibacter sp.]
MKKYIYSIALFFVVITFSACDDFFNPDTNEILPESEYVGSYDELYSGYMGIAASVQTVADQASFLEGLRGDLLEPTSNAGREVWDVYNHESLDGNSFASPVGYYNIIMNANDYLEHVFEYREVNPTVLSDDDYEGLIGGVIRYKVWAYLMLAKIYGEAVYFDDALTSYQDISNYPVLNFDQIIEKCRSLMIDGENGVDGLGTIKWSTELFPNQSASATNLMWDRICPPSECLLAEIYLYQNKFQKAWEQCVSIIKNGGEQEASYQLNLSEYNGEWKQFGYTFVRKEQICVMFYDYSLKQTNRYIQYYSNTYPNEYILRPTEVAMDRFANQKTSANIAGDKYRGSGITYKYVNSDWVLEKFLLGNETSDKIYTNDVQISLYRAAEIHMFLVESLIGLGRFEEALAFLNDGVGSYYNATVGKFNAPFEDYPSCLYQTSSTSEKANRGIRGRVDLAKVGEFALTSATALDTLVNMRRLDSLIVEETSLELAGEGKAFYAMNRMARRWSTTSDKSWAQQWIDETGSANPGNLWGIDVQNVWAEKIGAKYTNGKGAAVTSELESSLDNWFIKYDLSE